MAGNADRLGELATDSLARATGADARALSHAVRGVWSHDWRADPWSCGAYTYVLVGGTDAPAALSRSAEDTIFLAGEGTSADAMGTVEGAPASGERAARAVLKILSGV